MGYDYGAFLEDLAQRESSGQLDKVNDYGYLGLYQMGEVALIDAGYYQADGTSANDWAGSWTGKDGIYSKANFLASRPAQDAAVAAYHDKQWDYITHYGLDQYAGATVGDIPITESGLIAAAHLGGVGNLRSFLESGGSTVFQDGLGTPITQYLARFGGYDVTGFTGGSFTPMPVAPVLNGGGSGTESGTGAGSSLAAGPAFAAGSGLEPGVLSAVVVGVLAMTALTWAGWAVKAQWAGFTLGRLRFHGFLLGTVRIGVVLSLLLWAVL